MLPKVAAITMVYDEPMLLPIWMRHYARQVGADHCFVIDHGSSHAPALLPGVNVIRLPRSPHDDERRAKFVGQLTASLLQYFDWVLHTDVDELVLADPARFTDLTVFCAAAEADTVSAIGLDVQHVADEAALDVAQPVGRQRGWARFTSAMCKPVLTRQPVAWSPGFHSADQPVVFGPLYLFHLHWMDRASGVQRLAKTRSMAWAGDEYGAHQRVTDAAWLTAFDAMAGLPRVADVMFDPAAGPMAGWLDRVQESSRRSGFAPYGFDLHINAGELWAIPPPFRARL